MPARLIVRRARALRRRGPSPADAWIAQLVHDLRNPLGIVESFAEILPTAAPSERDELCDRLRVNARRALHVLEAFALLADLRNGSGPPQLVQLDAIELVRELVGEIEAIERRPARVRYPSDECVPIRASRPHVACAMRTLLHDTLRATAPDGTVDLAVDVGRGAAVFRLVAAIERGDIRRASGRSPVDRIALELAQRVASQHGGRLTVTRRGRVTTIALALSASA